MLIFQNRCVIIPNANVQTNMSDFRNEVNTMKEGIHPKYEQTKVKCACGAVIETGSTKADMRVDICSNCHPYFTGKQKLVDTGGRVDRFNKRFNRANNK